MTHQGDIYDLLDDLVDTKTEQSPQQEQQQQQRESPSPSRKRKHGDITKDEERDILDIDMADFLGDSMQDASSSSPSSCSSSSSSTNGDASTEEYAAQKQRASDREHVEHIMARLEERKRQHDERRAAMSGPSTASEDSSAELSDRDYISESGGEEGSSKRRKIDIDIETNPVIQQAIELAKKRGETLTKKKLNQLVVAERKKIREQLAKERAERIRREKEEKQRAKMEYLMKLAAEKQEENRVLERLKAENERMLAEKRERERIRKEELRKEKLEKKARLREEKLLKQRERQEEKRRKQEEDAKRKEEEAILRKQREQEKQLKKQQRTKKSKTKTEQGADVPPPPPPPPPPPAQSSASLPAPTSIPAATATAAASQTKSQLDPSLGFVDLDELIANDSSGTATRPCVDQDDEGLAVFGVGGTSATTRAADTKELTTGPVHHELGRHVRVKQEDGTLPASTPSSSSSSCSSDPAIPKISMTPGIAASLIAARQEHTSLYKCAKGSVFYTDSMIRGDWEAARQENSPLNLLHRAKEYLSREGRRVLPNNITQLTNCPSGDYPRFRDPQTGQVYTPCCMCGAKTCKPDFVLCNGCHAGSTSNSTGTVCEVYGCYNLCHSVGSRCQDCRRCIYPKCNAASVNKFDLCREHSLRYKHPDGQSRPQSGKWPFCVAQGCTNISSMSSDYCCLHYTHVVVDAPQSTSRTKANSTRHSSNPYVLFCFCFVVEMVYQFSNTIYPLFGVPVVP